MSVRPERDPDLKIQAYLESRRSKASLKLMQAFLLTLHYLKETETFHYGSWQIKRGCSLLELAVGFTKGFEISVTDNKINCKKKSE